MRATRMQNPDLLAAQMERDAVAVRLVGEPRDPRLRGHVAQEPDQVGAVVLVTDVERVPIDRVAAREPAMEGRRHQESHGLVGHLRDCVPGLPRNHLRAERVDHHHPVARDDHPAVEGGRHPRRLVGVKIDVVPRLDSLQAAGALAVGRLRGMRPGTGAETPFGHVRGQRAHDRDDEGGSKESHHTCESNPRCRGRARPIARDISRAPAPRPRRAIGARRSEPTKRRVGRRARSL